MNRTAFRALLLKHEGLKAKPYTDTRGKLTIGVGRNLTDKGISLAEANVLLDDDINEVFKQMPALTGAFGGLSDARQHALMDLTFNVGFDGARKFTKMLAAIEKQDFDAAADALLDSAAARELPERYKELASMLRAG